MSPFGKNSLPLEARVKDMGIYLGFGKQVDPQRRVGGVEITVIPALDVLIPPGL